MVQDAREIPRSSHSDVGGVLLSISCNHGLRIDILQQGCLLLCCIISTGTLKGLVVAGFVSWCCSSKRVDEHGPTVD